jgi:hypothetical protein
MYTQTQTPQDEGVPLGERVAAMEAQAEGRTGVGLCAFQAVL